MCLVLFVWLFLQTEYRGRDQLGLPVGFLFRLDPLALVADLFAPGDFHWRLLWPAFLLLVLTAILGRFFCGWICPLGTSLSALGTLFKRPAKAKGGQRKRWKYYLFIFLLLANLFGLQLFGLFDPLSIFLRTLTLALNPLWNAGLNDLFTYLYQNPVPLLSALADAAYPFFRDHLLSFHQPVFLLGLFTAAVFVVLLLLERLERRFWCRNLCPLGALLGLCAHRSRLVREPAGCADCDLCVSSCGLAAIDGGGHHRQDCVLCLDCLDYCPNSRTRFSLSLSGSAPAPVDLGRRGVLGAGISGALLASLVSAAPAAARQSCRVLRPPGAVPEEEFLRRCIRCGECMKVCIGRALQPDLFTTGPFGLWTPLLVARLGYCEFNCTLCGQVCPTGAIQKLSLEQKQKTVIGLAVIDKNRCLPFAGGQECLVCEEHCPTGEKAIVFEPVEVLVNGKLMRLRRPGVVARLCVGCGICETRCPVAGQSAIRVVSEGESRTLSSSLY